ncbi:MAG: hypothetical protein CV088_13055 [Nitrospira sp. LK70]|nr:hypothetical protein [Nitrospira sp. LK70]
MKHGGKLPALLLLSFALWWPLAPVVVMAKVQVLPEATLLMEGKKVTRQNGLLRHPVVTGLLAAFERAESALKNEDIDTLMQFYAPSYDYHGLKESDVRRVWGEVFEHYKSIESLHLFSDIKVSRVNDGFRAEVTCTGGLYGIDERSGDRVTLDSWFREVHYLVKEGDAWRFLGNAGEVPTAAPFASAPHHPLF